MKAVVFAITIWGCAGTLALLEAGYDIAAIFTHPDTAGENHFFSSVARIAAERGIPVYAPDDVNHPLWVERIRALAPDVIFSFYYRNLICDEILGLAAKGAFNLHGSLLPAYRGRAPLNWVLVNGETETGVTLHRMVHRADAGGPSLPSTAWQSMRMKRRCSCTRNFAPCTKPAARRAASYPERHLQRDRAG